MVSPRGSALGGIRPADGLGLHRHDPLHVLSRPMGILRPRRHARHIGGDGYRCVARAPDQAVVFGLLEGGAVRASGYDRVVNDWYVEDRAVVDALLDVETFPGVVWDPSCGSGNIPNAILARGGVAHGSDIADRGYGLTGHDFFSCPPVVADHIVTNPPFGVIEPYIRRALTLVPGKVCVLARLAFLEGAKRQAMFRETPLARVWVSSRRVSMPPGGMDIKASGGTVAYAWFVFEHGHAGKPTLGWLPN